MRKLMMVLAVTTFCQIDPPQAQANPTVEDCNRISNKDRRRVCLQALVDAGRYEAESHSERAKGYDNARQILCIYDKAGKLVYKAYKTVRNAADLASRGASSCKSNDR